MDAETESLLDIPPFLRREAGMATPIDTTPPKREWKMPDMSVYEEAKKKRAAREARSVEIKQEKIAVRQRAQDWKRSLDEDMNSVVVSLRKGNNTVIQLRKDTGIESKLITRALKYLIKNNRVEKVSKKTYKHVTNS